MQIVLETDNNQENTNSRSNFNKKICSYTFLQKQLKRINYKWR